MMHSAKNQLPVRRGSGQGANRMHRAYELGTTHPKGIDVQSIIRDVQSQLFSTRSSIVGNRLLVELSGCLDMDTSPLLKAFLDPLIRDIEAGIVSELEFRTCELYLMSSSSISCFATWIKQLKTLPTKCKVLFRTNPDLDWQRRTLDPIRRLALQIVWID